MERLVKGIWIPIEIWKDTTLSWNEKILLMEIDSFTSKDLDCFFSDEYISQMLNVSDRQARNIISSLVQKGWIEKTRFDGRRRFLKSNLCLSDRKPISYQEGDEFPHNNIEEQINNKRESIRETFKKPSVEEVSQYCSSRQNGIDAEEFVAFYESKGWMVGKTKMKDWKSAIITWEKARKKEKRSTYQPPKKKSVFEQNLSVMDAMFGTNYHDQAYGKKEDTDEQ